MPHATTRIFADLSRSLKRNASTLASSSSRAKRGDERAIHRLRVATRRLREAVPAAIEATGTDDEDLVRDLRRVTKGLGFVRELDVSRTVLAKLAGREAWPIPLVARIDEYCRRMRERAFEDATESLESLDARAARRRVNAIAKEIEGLKGRRVSRGVLPARLRARARALVREIDVAGTIYAPGPLHRVRIAIKKLRYVLELAGEQVPARQGSLRRLKKMQSLLGRLHDAHVLQLRILTLTAGTGDRALVTALTAIDRSIEADCRQLHAEALKGLPGLTRLASAIIAAVPSTIGPRQIGRPAKMTNTGRRKTRIA